MGVTWEVAYMVKCPNVTVSLYKKSMEKHAPRRLHLVTCFSKIRLDISIIWCTMIEKLRLKS